MLPVVLITPGEPAGIGPDIVLQMASQPIEARIVCIADVTTMRNRASLLDLDIQINEVTDISAVQKHHPGKLDVLAVELEQTVIPGQLNSANAPYVLDCLRLAVELISRKQAHALVTGPVHKGIINEAGIAFTGHTEFLAELTNGTPVMMLAADTLRVALVTTHLPLSQVSASITSEKLRQVIHILHHDLVKDFSIAQPVILICGLNPHAGEDGHLGREEIEIIEPVIKELRRQGMKLTGPLPADTLFTPHHLQHADAVLAMYHDQGLPVLKHVGFGHAVNITLGLPIIRTSVDHGTALDLAGTGKANAGSLNTALDLAIQLANNSLAN